MTHTLVIDQGTHASRAIVFSSTGSILNTAQQSISLIQHSHSHIEQNPEAILQSVQTVIQQVLATSSNEITNCALTTQRSTILAWHNESLKSLYPALSWQDTRSKDDLKQFLPHEKRIRQITGLPLSPHYGAGKFRWLLNYLHHHTDNIKQSFSLGPLASFLLCHLSSKQQNQIDHSNAHRTLLFNINELKWSDELLTLFGIDRKYLPRCLPVQYDYGTLTNTGITISSVSGDQNAALFSQGAIPDNTAIVNLGTGAFILAPCSKTITDDRLLKGIARSNGHTEYLLEGTVNGAGAALGWAESQWPVTDLYHHLDTWLNTITRPPIFINTIGSLGSPWWISDIEPYFLTNSENMRTEDRYVAIIESIVFLIHNNLQQLLNHFDIKTLRVSGGLSQLNGLCQTLADLSGCSVNRLNDSEASARGAAWLAAGCPENWSQQCSKTFSSISRTDLDQRYRQFTAELSRF